MWRRIAAVSILAPLVAGPAAPTLAAEIDVIDGRTFRIDGERIRIRADAWPIDAPSADESGTDRAKCALELELGQAARARLRQLVSSDVLSIRREGLEPGGGFVAVVYARGGDLGARLVREGLARPWPRLTAAEKPDWCPAD